MKIRLFAALAVLCCTMTAHTQVYNVLPIDLGMGYSIEPGGTMTITDGKLSDWYIAVGGEYPFIFQSPLRRGVEYLDFILFENVDVSDDAISVESGTLGGLGFGSSYTEGCMADLGCYVRFGWDTESSIIELAHSGLVSGGGLNPDSVDAEDFLFREFARQPLVGTVVVAVASEQVPEPTTGMLTAMGLLGLVGFSRRRRR